VESSCELGNEISGSLTTAKISSGNTSDGLSSSALSRRFGYLEGLRLRRAMRNAATILALT
jgi:hypothetical protein